MTAAEERLTTGYTELVGNQELKADRVPKSFYKKVYVEKIQAEEMTLQDVPELFRDKVEYIINNPDPTTDEQAVIDSIIAEVQND